MNERYPTRIKIRKRREVMRLMRTTNMRRGDKLTVWHATEPPEHFIVKKKEGDHSVIVRPVRWFDRLWWKVKG